MGWLLKLLSQRWMYTIRTKLAGVIAVLIAAISLFILYYFPAKLEHQAISAIAAKAQNISEITAFRLGPGLTNQSREHVEEVLTRAYQNQDVAYIIILDAKGDEFAAFNREKAIRAKFALEKDDDPISQDGFIYRTMIPILNKGRRVGQLYLGFCLEELRGEVARSQRTTALISIVIFVVAMIAVFGISTIIIRPLTNMVKTVERIARGDLSRRASVSSRDEVGHLAGSFNLMVSNLEQEINERKRVEGVLRKRTVDLNERIKELNCLYEISRLIEKPNISIREILQGTVDLLPATLQYPEIACARIVLEGEEFTTQNFTETMWELTADIAVHGRRVGYLQVCYLEERPEGDEGPFVKEARALIDAIAQRLGRIAERRRAQEALLVEKAHLERLFESAQEAIVMTDCNGKVLRTNKEFTRLFGYTQDEAAGRLVDDLVAPDQQHEEAAALTRRVSERENVSVESVRWRKDGTSVYVSILGSPIVVHGETVGVYAIYRDITDRKRAEEALQRKTRQQAELLQTARNLTESLEIREVLTRIGAGAKEILRAHGCVIYLLEEDGQTLTPVAAVDPSSEEAVLSTRINVETSFTGQAIKSKRGVVFNDVLDKSFGQQIRGTPLEVNARIIAVPFCIGEKVLGAMCIDRVGTPFTDEDLALAEAYALYATTALKNAQMYNDLQREMEERKQSEKARRESRRKIEGLHDAARSLEACQGEDEVYRIAVKSAEEILEFSMCSLDMVEGKKLVVKATSSGLPSGASVETGLEETSLAVKTYRTGKTIRFSNLREVPEASPTRAEFQSGISAPLGDIGVFQVVSTEADAFSMEDERLLELLLGHTAEAIRRIRLQNQLRDQATRDPLTGLYNRRYFREAVEREIERSKRYKHSIGFLMIDVDSFKEINDTYGHQTGDLVLQSVADFLRNQVRTTEMVVRYGGDEFLVVMPEMKDDTDVVRQRLIEGLTRWNETNRSFDFPVRLSLGGANWDPSSSESVEEALTRADMRMYEDKKRNLPEQPVEKIHSGGEISG